MTSVVVSVAFFALLYVSTERYRVFANDWLPILHWMNVVQPEPMLKLAAGFGVVAGFSFILLWAAARNRLAWLLFVVLVPVFSFLREDIIRQRHVQRTVSCANHAGVWWRTFDPDFDFSRRLPASTEFTDMLLFLSGEEIRPWLRAGSCPGSNLAGTKTGVVFVGGGLKLSDLNGGNLLVAFCDWRCHPVPHDHLHAMVWHRERLERECMHNRDIIPAIERALKAAESGQVPYAPAAVAELREQLAQRKAMAK